jgi:hypothetical protein
MKGGKLEFVDAIMSRLLCTFLRRRTSESVMTDQLLMLMGGEKLGLLPFSQ